MYSSFFGLIEKPFSITPDPRYLFMSERHGEALAHLVYGVTQSGGFVQLTGEVGTGKTTLVRTLLLNRMPDNADVAVVMNPQISVLEFLVTICEELGIAVPEANDSIKALTDALNRHLLDAHAEGRRTILIVDEAQNLSPAVLEQVRLLTNLETSKQKLLQIVLIGQPELRELLGRNDLRQLAQRITGRYHLEPLSLDETTQYIEHRLRVAGALGEIIDSGAKKEVFRISQGIPRLVNVICDRALLGAYAQESRIITKHLIRDAAAEVSGELDKSVGIKRFSMVAGVASLVLALISIWAIIQYYDAPGAVANSSELKPVIMNTPTSTSSVGRPGAQEDNDSPQSSEIEPVSLSDELELAGVLTSTDFAFTSLFDLWRLEYTRGSQAGCSQAAAAGLACLTQQGSWNRLRQLNRPAVLTIVDNSGDAHELVLTAIDGDRARLSIGGVMVNHPISEITELWFGEFTLLWQPPGGEPLSLSSGSRGAAVAWLRQSLAEIDSSYQSKAPESDQYDADLQAIVRNFQQRNRLVIDGVAGQQTLIIINSQLKSDGSPRLTASRPPEG